jgi:thiosulfate/3-mercaptopyruvate sulfurtransferase
VTAAILMLALVVAGAQDVALYDGSWSEWGARPEAPAQTE